MQTPKPCTNIRDELLAAAGSTRSAIIASTTIEMKATITTASKAATFSSLKDAMSDRANETRVAKIHASHTPLRG